MASAAAGVGEAPAATNASGTRYVGEWALGHRIGSGSFAVVWKAVHGGSGEVAAVKEIWTEKLNAKLRESLESEMSILTRTEHPNIVRLLEIIKEKEAGRIYLVLEFCAGGDLSGLLRRVRTLPEAVLRSLMQQLAAGLRELRSLNLIHRDLKPQNLLLSGPGPDAVLKIADFGFARDLQPQGLAETLCGSPLYMAPEILQFRKYDAKADLWSIGAILFEMAAGQPPFNGRNHVELLRNIERQEARLPVAAAARTSPACKQLLTMLLRRNPVERIGFEEFFSHPFLSDAPPSPPGPPTPAPSTAISPRDRPPRAAQQPPPGRPPASPSPSPTIRAVSSPLVPEVRVAAVPVEATTPAAAVVARTAPGTGGGMAALMEAASGGSGSRFTPSSLPRLPAALWDAFSGGRAASNAQDQRRQQFGPLGEGLKLVERAASGGSLTESFERDFVVISQRSSPASSAHSDHSHANAAIANLSMPSHSRDPTSITTAAAAVTTPLSLPAKAEAAAAVTSSPSPRPAAALIGTTLPASWEGAPRGPFLESVAERILALAAGRIAGGAPAEALVLSWLAMRTLVEAGRSGQGTAVAAGPLRRAREADIAGCVSAQLSVGSVRAGVLAAMETAVAQAEAASEALHAASSAAEDEGGDVSESRSLPCPFELAYRLALDYGRAGAVDELMGNFSRSAASYCAATQLLAFLLEEVPRMEVSPALPEASRSLPPSDERRLRRYLRTLTQRSAVCTLRCAPPAAPSTAPPTVPTTLRQQPPRAAVPNRSAKTPALRPAGLHLH